MYRGRTSAPWGVCGLCCNGSIMVVLAMAVSVTKTTKGGGDSPPLRRSLLLPNTLQFLAAIARTVLSDRESVERTESVIAKESCILVDSTPKVLEK